MAKITSELPPRHQPAHDAMHPPWRIRKQSAIFRFETPVAPNILPIADEMLRWLKQTGHLSLFTESDRGHPLSFTNPYTYSASSLAAQLASTINQAADFVASANAVDPIEAELQRIRLESELTLQFARFCEATMKQMLYCTSLPESLYKKAAIGRLLAFACAECRKVGQPHFVSMLGALAHHYFDCPMLEHCLFDHLAFVGTKRNQRAAHSESETPRFSTIGESRSALNTRLDEVGQELGHMCEHLGALEKKMIAEIQLWITHYPKMPPQDDLMRIPVRLSDILDTPVAGPLELSEQQQRDRTPPR